MARTYARNGFERCVQVLRWLNEEFDLFEAGAVRLELVDKLAPHATTGKESLFGCVEESKGKLTIILSRTGCQSNAVLIDTLLHEAAHVALWDTGRGLLHGDEFWRTAGRFYDAYDHHGWQDSKSYFVD